MDSSQSSQHLCYVHCNFCNTVLAVEIPWKRLMESVTVKCGHCSNLLVLSQLQGQYYDHQTLHPHHHQDLYSEYKKGHSAAPSSSSTPDEPSSPRSPFVAKPPEKKHRLPSAYNRFMKEEIQRIKTANPEVPHREAFSAAAKNWARYIPNTSQECASSSSNNVKV